jgi:FkbM family methyltransferase
MNISTIQNISVLNGALWNKPEKLSIVNTGANKDSFQVAAGVCSNGSTIASFTIHDIVKRNAWSSIDILKIDVEGAEKDIFEDSYNLWLDLVKILIIELHEDYRPGCGESVFKALVGRGFQYYRRGENYIFIRSYLGLKISP